MDMDADELKYPVVLARNVQKFSVECWDGQKQEWVEEWQDTNSIPVLLRVQLVTGDNTRNARAQTTTTTRLLSLPSQTMPASAQSVQGGVPGNPNQIRPQPRAPGGRTK
jgi:hypothetical protein